MAGQLELLTSACRSCGAPVVWAVVHRSGRRIPLDRESLAEPRPGIAAYNPATGRCHIVSTADLYLTERWREAGATFHRTHFASCPQADRWRVTPEAEPA